MEKLKILVIGGSASNNFGNSQDSLGWPELLAKNLGDTAEVTHISRGGLTFLRGINELAVSESTDLLIMHFGTSIGWPISIVKAGTVMGIDFASDYGFNQPSGLSKVKAIRMKNLVKRCFRDTIKYVLFFIGLYKPRASKRELEDQINAVVKLAQAKSGRFIWIQHRAFLNPRIFLEKLVYDRYFKKIMAKLRSLEIEGLTIVEIPDQFLVAENYLFDCVHLSSKGHEELEKIVRKAI